MLKALRNAAQGCRYRHFSNQTGYRAFNDGKRNVLGLMRFAGDRSTTPRNAGATSTWRMIFPGPDTLLGCQSVQPTRTSPCARTHESAASSQASAGRPFHKRGFAQRSRAVIESHSSAADISPAVMDRRTHQARGTVHPSGACNHARQRRNTRATPTGLNRPGGMTLPS